MFEYVRFVQRTAIKSKPPQSHVRLTNVFLLCDIMGKGYSGGQELDWMKDLEEDLKAFGIKFEGWREAAQKIGRWF